MNLTEKLVFAVLSGCLVMLAFLWFNESDTWYSVTLYFGACGALFAGGVLLPLVSAGRLLNWRTAGLVLTSSLSFWLALRVASDWASGLFGPDLESYLLGSLAGAAVVLIPAPFLLGLRYSPRFLIASVVAAVLGGLLFFAFSESFYYGLFLSFASWHAAMCGALHVAYGPESVDGWAAGQSRSVRRAIVGVTAAIVALPVAEEAIGTLIVDGHVNREGGMTVNEAFDARGFRDQRWKPWYDSDCSFGCADPIIDGRFEFQEIEVQHAQGRYQRLFVADRPDPNCLNDVADWKPPLVPRYDTLSPIGSGRCLSYRLSDEPRAPIALRDKRNRVDVLFGLFPLQKYTRQIVRLSDDAVLVEAVYFEFDSRLFGTSMGDVATWPEFLSETLTASPD